MSERFLYLLLFPPRNLCIFLGLNIRDRARLVDKNGVLYFGSNLVTDLDAENFSDFA